MRSKESLNARITAYTLDALSDELDALTRHPVDPYSKFIYDRLRELYWTSSRATRHLARLGRGAERAGLSGAERAGVRGGTLPSAVPKPPACGRLFIETTNTVETGTKTGIQRVVREIALQSVLLGEGLPVVISEGRLTPYYRHASLPTKIAPGPGDILLILDAAWNNVGVYPPVLKAVKAAGGKIVVAVYDILPLLYPALFPQEVARNFRAWREGVLQHADTAVAISRATAESLADYERGEGRTPPPIGWWRLGADFNGAATGAGAPSAAVARVASGGPYLLSVGTLEPRKGYPIALDAFERLWGEGREVSYVIVGRAGWNTSALGQRIRRHPEFGQRLFWFDGAGDADLRALYANARAVVNASLAEGFGLPLVEAAFHGAPVIASDIEVFREVGGDGARYFDPLDAASLAAAIAAELAGPRIAPAIATISWRESAQELARLIRDEAYPL
jgi:glycosyltransferase involved in cell wall biosynthesis